MAGIGENIRERRKSLGMTQLVLASLMNYQPQTVGKWERGESEPDLTLLCTIADVLDFSLEELTGLGDRNFGAPKMMFSHADFCSSLRIRRCDRELRQTDLADELKLRSQTISKWENGVSLPDLYYIEKLCDFYQISITELVCTRNLPCHDLDKQVAEIEQQENELKPIRKGWVAFVRRRWISAVSVLIAAVMLIFVVPLNVKDFLNAGSGGGLSSSQPEQPNQPETPDNSETWNGLNKYRLELKTSKSEIYNSTMYEEASIVDEPVLTDVKRENYVADGWTDKQSNYPTGFNDSNRIIFPLSINYHTTIYVRWVYLWAYDPQGYIDDEEAYGEKYNYTDCLILESFVVEINEWLKQCLVFNSKLQEAGASSSAWSLVNKAYPLFDTDKVISINGLNYSEPTIAETFRRKCTELKGGEISM